MFLPEGDRGRLSVPILMESLRLLEPLEVRLTCMILRRILGLSKPEFKAEAPPALEDNPLFEEALELLLVLVFMKYENGLESCLVWYG